MSQSLTRSVARLVLGLLCASTAGSAQGGEIGRATPLPVARFDGRVRVHLHSGLFMEGCCLRIDGGSVTLNSGLQVFRLDEVAQIEIRKSRAAPLARLTGGCCGLFMLLNFLSYDDGEGDGDLTRWDFLAGGVLWTGVFTVAGAVVGHLASDWEPIYFSFGPKPGAAMFGSAPRPALSTNTFRLGVRRVF